MSVLPADSLKWAEVDTHEDLSAAEALFGREAQESMIPKISR